MEDDVVEATPPDLPDTAPPELPETSPPELPETAPPDVPETVPPELPETGPPDELPEASPTELPEATPPDLPEALDQEALLMKLEQQNKLLEQDSHFTTQITPKTSSSSLFAVPQQLSTSDLSSSRSNSPSSHDPTNKDILPQGVTTPTKDTPTKDTPTNDTPTEPKTPQDMLAQQSNKRSHEDGQTSSANDPSIARFTAGETTPTDSHEATPTLSSPEASLSPDPSPSLSFEAPSRDLESPTEIHSKPPISAYSAAGVGMVTISEGEESGEGEGLGPEVSVILGPQQDVKIPYQVAKDMEVLPELAPEGEREGGELEENSHMTPQDPNHVVADSPMSEERDTLADLPSPASPSPHPGKGRRSRSETESRSLKVPLISFKGRKRSHTLHEGGVVKEKEEQEEGLETPTEETRWQQWSEILKHWEEVFPKNNKVVKQLSRQGIPEHLRGMAWQLLSDSINAELKEQYPTLITETSPHERAIRRDLNRTFPEHSFFKERDGLGQESLLNVLKAYSVYDKEVGYCQGSPFMAGLLLMQMPEEEAFCVLVQLMSSYKMRDLYKPSMADLSLCFYQLDKLVEEMFPSLSMHFKAVGFQPSMYASPWFLTLFASVLSLNIAFRVMDLLLVEGREIVFKVGLALLEISQDQLLRMDMEDMIKYFQKGMKSAEEIEEDALISKALKIKLNAKKMKKFGKEYLDKKARKALEISEMGRLQTENMEMVQKLNQLHQECDTLREQLINGQLTRAQQAEEMLQLRNELAGTRRRLNKLETEGVGGDNDQREGAVAAAVPEWAETNGKQETHVSKVLPANVRHSPTHKSESTAVTQPPQDVPPTDTSSNHAQFDIYKDSSVSPQESPMIKGVLDRGSKENLFLEESTPDTSPALGTPQPEEKKKKKKKLLGRSKSDKRSRDAVKSFDQDHESTGSPPPCFSPTEGKKEGKKKKKNKHHHHHTMPQHELEQELALAKTTCADYANQLEIKTLELKQVVQREAFLIRELKEIEARLSRTPSGICPYCQNARDTTASPTQSQGATTPPSSSQQDTGPNSSHSLLANLRAIWNSSPQASKKDLT